MTREAKLAVHLEHIIFNDQPPGTRLSNKQILELMSKATPEQRKRAYERALVRCPILLDDEREEDE